MEVVETTVTDIIRRAGQVLSVRLAMKSGQDLFQAGQFLGVTLNSAGAEISRYLSFSSSPTEKGYIEFTKRLTGSDFSQALSRLRVGDKAKLKYPMGKFVLDEAHGKHAFLAGGIGITPIRSIWKYAFDRRLQMDMVLLYGNRTAEDIIFRDDFEEISARDKGYRVVYSLDSLERLPAGWKGRCGLIDAAMIQEVVPDHKERIFYVCGPTLMVKNMADTLKSLAVPEANIRRENISGYC